MVVFFHLNRIPGPTGLWNALLMVQALKNLKSWRPKQDWMFLILYAKFHTGKKVIDK